MFESTKAALRQVIEDALAKRYTSVSSYQDLPTNNHYQSVRLGEQATAGFREGRDSLFSLFDFSGRTVADYGCNLGELSRLARRRGAMLVDGYEYDNYFVMMARLITAYNELQRVSFFQRDLTVRSAYETIYDVALAFSVFPYIREALDVLAKKTNDLLILETHDIKESLQSTYMEPVGKYFRFHALLGITEHGHGKGRRAVIAFAKALDVFCGDRACVKSTIDLDESSLPFLEEFFSRAPKTLLRELNGEALVKALLESGVFDKEDDLWLEGTFYWRAMMEGYLQYKSDGTVSERNAYLLTFQRYLESSVADVALKAKMANRESVAERVKRRFDDADLMLSEPHMVAPVNLINVSFAENDGKYRLRHAAFRDFLFCNQLDGYHRLFWAKLFGVRSVNALAQVGQATVTSLKE